MTTRIGHRIFVTQNSMSRERLNVLCTCGELYVDQTYLTLREDGTNAEPDPIDADNDNYGVPLSVLMDIAEQHFADVDRW